MKKHVKMDLTSRTIDFLVKILGKTWTFAVSDISGNSPYSSKGMIYCTWHENILPLSYYFKSSKASFIASYSKDGKRLSSILQHWGGRVIEGSSRRKGLSAIRESVKELKKGKNLVITPDGPRGPRRVVKKGIAQIAILSKTSVVGVCIHSKNLWRLRSWDAFIIPKPFATIAITFHKPILCEKKDRMHNSIDTLTTKIQTVLTVKSK